MYCIKCGVELAESQKVCPLCKTKVCHPDIEANGTESLYPVGKYPKIKAESKLIHIIFCAAFLLPILITLLCDLQFNNSVTWSGYAIGAILLGYIVFFLPKWFNSPNPVIFVPCNFAATALYLWYINYTVGGDWFLSFALPVVGIVAAIVITVVTLLHYLRRGKLFIFGGATIAFGGFMLLLEFLMSCTFDGVKFIGWSLYPLITLVIFGIILLFLGISRSARESMKRLFFI